MKRCVALFLVCMILLGNICMAAPLPKKKETVYVNLDSYGTVEKINIYSKWITNGYLQLQDNTRYISLNNLTNREKYTVSGDTYLWNVSGEKKFIYTGEVGEEYYDLIPWTFDISYKVNGVEVTADELLGAKGLIKITMDIKSNRNANPYFINNYMLEITGTYDMSKYLSVESEDAMVTDTGNTKTLMFIVLPGQSTTLNIEIGSEDFSMNGITMALVPISGDIRNQLIELAEDKEEIENAVEAINTSSDTVLVAMGGMTAGLSGVSSGVNELKKGTQKLHGLNELRDEDILKLKEILNEILPLMNDIQSDIDNLNKNYDIIIEFDESLNEKLLELNKDVNELNSNSEELYKLVENLPSDVNEINKLLKATESVVNSSNSLIKKLSGSSNESAESLTSDLSAIAYETSSIGTMVQQTIPNVNEPDTVQVLISIGNSASNIGNSLKSVQGTLNEMSENTLSGTKNLQRDLNDLGEELHEVSNILNKKDAQKIVDEMYSLKETSKILEEMLQTVINYNNQLLSNKNDFKESTNNAKQLVNELSQMNSLSLSMITNAQSMLNILDSDFYNGTNNTLDALTNVNNQLIQITSQSKQIKQSKDEIKKLVDDKIDELEQKTTVFNLNEKDEIVSFGSEKNEFIESVQFVIKTPDIKKVKINNEDLESHQNTIGFWKKIGLIFQKIWNWILDIFKF